MNMLKMTAGSLSLLPAAPLSARQGWLAGGMACCALLRKRLRYDMIATCKFRADVVYASRGRCVPMRKEA